MARRRPLIAAAIVLAVTLTAIDTQGWSRARAGARVGEYIVISFVDGSAIPCLACCVRGRV